MRDLLNSKREIATAMLPWIRIDIFDNSDNRWLDNANLTLALLLELWGRYIPPESIVKRIKLCHQLRMQGHHYKASLPKSVKLTTVVQKIATRHPDWGLPYLQALFEYAEGDKQIMHHLLKSAIVTIDGSLAWSNPLVASILDSSTGVLRKKLESSAIWEFAALRRPLDVVLDFLHSKYPSDESKIWLQRRESHLADRFRSLLSLCRFSVDTDQETLEIDLWHACSRGDAKRVMDLVMNYRVRLRDIPWKHNQGRWSKSNAFEAAASNGHVRCCKMLLKQYSLLEEYANDLSTITTCLSSMEQTTDPNERRIFEALKQYAGW